MFYLLIAHFFAAQLIAMLAGWSFIGAGITMVEQPADVGNALFLFAYIVVLALIMLFAMRYYKGKMLFLLLELYLIFVSVQILTAMFTNDLVGLALGVLALAIRLKFPETRRYLILIVSGVVAALIGASLDIVPMAVFAVLLSGYDYVAVFITKHMITMAKELKKREAAVSVALKHKKSSVELGTGDLVVPGALIVSAMKLSLGHAIATLIGSVIGIIAVLLILSRRKGYLPALPPIVGYSLAALAAYQLAPF